MNFPEVIKRDPFFSLSISLFNPLKAKLRRTSQVDYSSQWTIFSHFSTDSIIDSIFCLVHVTLTVHDLAKDVTVSQRRPLRKMKFGWLFSNGFVPEDGSGMEGVELEGKGPSFWIFVVVFENISSLHFLPLLNRFPNDGEVEEGQECALSGSQVTLY